MPSPPHGHAIVAAAVLLIGAVIAGAVLLPPKAVSQTGGSITGYAWSDTIGWIRFDGPNYGITINADGTIEGYAWSDNIGWVSAQLSDVSGCPASPCAPKLSGGALTGWLKALAGGTSQSGGWDGWLSLSGASYGVTHETGGGFSGYAWGSDVVGWVDFSYAYADYQQCTPAYFCVDGDQYYRNAQCTETFQQTCAWGCSGSACLPPPSPAPSLDGTLRARPSLVRQGNSARIFWDILYADTCTVSGNGDSWSATVSPEAGYTSRPITHMVTYALSCTNEAGSLEQTATVRVIPIWLET